MKKIFALVSAVALVAAAAVSCQKAASVSEEGLQKITITASAPLTKVTYSEKTAGTLTPAWTVGDKVYSMSNNYSAFTVTKVENGIATIEGLGADGEVTLYYCPTVKTLDKTASMKDQLASDPDKVPAAFVCTTTISGGKAEGTFTLASSLLVIKNAKGLPKNAAVSKVVVVGDKLASLKVAKTGADGKAAVTTWDDFASADLSAAPAKVTDAGTGALDKPVFVAVPASASIKSITLVADGEAYVCKASSPKATTKEKYLYVDGSRSFTKTVISLDVKNIVYDGCDLAITADEDVHYLYGVAPAEEFAEFTDEEIIAGELAYYYDKYGTTYSKYGYKSYDELFFDEYGLSSYGKYTYDTYQEGLEPETEYIAYVYGVTYGITPSTKLIKKTFTTPAAPAAEDYYSDFLGDWDVTFDVMEVQEVAGGVEFVVAEENLKNTWNFSEYVPYGSTDPVEGVYLVGGIFNYGEYPKSVNYLAAYDGIKKCINFPVGGTTNPGDQYYDYTKTVLGCYGLVVLHGITEDLYYADSFKGLYNASHNELTPEGAYVLVGDIYEYNPETGAIGAQTDYSGTDIIHIKTIKKATTKSSTVKAASSKGRILEKADARDFSDYKFRSSLKLDKRFIAR